MLAFCEIIVKQRYNKKRINRNSFFFCSYNLWRSNFFYALYKNDVLLVVRLFFKDEKKNLKHIYHFLLF